MTENRRAAAGWKTISLQEIESYFNKEIKGDIKTIIECCLLLSKNYSIHILDASKSYNLLAVVTNESAWIYEISKDNSQYYHMTYLSRDDCYFLIRQMNEKIGGHGA